MSDQEQTIYLITNRNLISAENGKLCFGKTFHKDGAHELRLAKITGTPKKWKMKLVEETEENPRPSKDIFKEFLKRMHKRKRNCLFFVHGFNNVVEDVVERCMNFQKVFKVEVIAFSWPADEGIKGATNYRSQKLEAQQSVYAFDRCLKKLNEYLIEFVDERCDLTFNLALHSMGNYLLKNFMKSSEHARDALIFDNIILMAADTNNEGHADWVDQLQHRTRIYITINEYDTALKLSAMKFGALQKVRLGHYTKNLSSNKVVYLDFTHADGVGDSHAYFEGASLKNTRIKEIFRKMFNGQTVEETLEYDPNSRLHHVK
jgi:esterase/lipase superfamily enzyme